MTMGEKIVALRKKECWSQEDLADRLDVSRQSVSKWEGDLAAPTLDKLLELSRLFGVSTDYLIKDELESPEPETPDLPAEPETEPLRQVTLEEARAFADLKEASARPRALAVALCILSPVCLILLGGLKTYYSLHIPMSDGAAGGLGLTALFAFIIPAVAIFVRWGMKLDKYDYLEDEVFIAAPGVEELARSRMEALAPARTKRLTAGVCLCVISAVPVILTSLRGNMHTLVFAVGGVGLLLVLVAAGVYLIMTVSTPWDAYRMLLQEGDYAPEKKRPLYRALPPVYWCAVTAGYLAWSFATRRWDFTWIVWPPAGVLFAGLMALLNLLAKRKKH